MAIKTRFPPEAKEELIKLLLTLLIGLIIFVTIGIIGGFIHIK